MAESYSQQLENRLENLEKLLEVIQGKLDGVREYCKVKSLNHSYMTTLENELLTRVKELRVTPFIFSCGIYTCFSKDSEYNKTGYETLLEKKIEEVCQQIEATQKICEKELEKALVQIQLVGLYPEEPPND